MKKILTFILIILSAGLFAANHINSNMDTYTDCDKIIIDDYSSALNDYSFVNGGKVSATDKFVKESKKSLLWEYTIDKYRNQTVGFCKNNINLPVPKTITFYIYPNAKKHYHSGIQHDLKFYIGIMDSKGNRVVKFPYFDVHDAQWNQITLNVAELEPFAVGAPGIEDVSTIFFGTQEGTGEFTKGGKYSAYFSPITFIYDYGKGIKQRYTDEEINVLRDAVKGKFSQIETKLSDLQGKGLCCRYELSAYTVIKQFIDFSKAEQDNGKLNRAYTQLEYISSLADKTINSLNEIEKDNTKDIKFIDINPNNLKVKNGTYYDGKRPVFLVGVMGWQSLEDFKLCHDLGFNYSEPEFFMSKYEDPAEIHGAKVRLDVMAQNHMAAAYLLSPHYMAPETYEKYPDIDPKNKRRIANFFMPWNVESKGLREYLSDYVSKLVPVIKDCPNLVGYDLVNEFWYDMLNDFDYETFKNSEYAKEDPWKAQHEYTQHNSTAFLKWFRDEVEKYDATRPIYTKVIGFGEVIGADREAIAGVLSGQGIDQINHYVNPDSEFAVELWEQSINLDSFRSFDENKVIMDGEYHVIPFSQKNMSEDIMNLCMWNNYFRGKDGNGVWVWGREIENDTNPLYCQPEAVYALAKSALDVNRVAEYVEPFSHIKGEYAIFYGGSDLENFYIGADFNDINFDFLTNTQAETGKIDYKLIFIMDDATVSEKAMANIKSSGAKVIKVKSYKNYKDYYRQVKAETGNCKKLVNINKWGIECRSYEKDGKIYYYLMNYTKKPINITLPKESRDMLTGKIYKKIEVQSAGVYLFECQK